MSGELEELMALRPKVSELINALARERRAHAETRQLLVTAEHMLQSVRAQLVALRLSMDHTAAMTPPMGNPAIETDAVTRKNREHG